MKQLIAALAALALTAAPALAAPQPIAPASETVQGSELRGRSAVYWVLPALIIVALLLAMTAGDGSNAQPQPASP